MNALLLLIALPWLLCAAAVPGFFRAAIARGGGEVLPSQAAQSPAFGRR